MNDKLRLDEVLVREGLVSASQIREALMYQKERAGKLGSQLLYCRYIDEAGLVKGLTIQFGCRGILLSDIEIASEVLNFIPQKVALARHVIPFDYDPEANILKIACENPNDENLINELYFVTRGKNVELYVAAELAIKTTIDRFYQNRNVSLDDILLSETQGGVTDTEKIQTKTNVESNNEPQGSRGDILIVSDEEYSANLLKSLLEHERYNIVVTDSADDAIDEHGGCRFHAVLIKDTVPGDYIDLIDRLRKSSPQTVVRYYESAAELILQGDYLPDYEKMAVKNLEMFTSLLSTKGEMVTNHSGTVGQYADNLCQYLGLPARERLQITTAGYLHDLSRYYYSQESSKDPRATLSLTVKLLQSLNYSPTVVEILRSMYVDLGNKFTKRLPIEALGGNILTIVDIFCDNIPAEEHLNLDKFDTIKKKFRDLAGKLFMREVAEAFIAMIQEQILSQQTFDISSQVMIVSAHAGYSYPLELRLKNEGFRVVTYGSPNTFAELYQRSKPDILVLIIPGKREEVESFIKTLPDQGVDFLDVPTFVLTDSSVVSSLTSLMKQGIEDILAIDANTDLFVVKMHKIHSSIEKQRRRVKDVSNKTTGRLSDMSLIDILQALGPGRKTTRITVSPNTDEADKLTIYLDSGAIIYARLGDKLGAEAVYEGLGWIDGGWGIEPVTQSKLPKSNNNLPTESILLEGCRILDEKAKVGLAE